MMGGGQMTSVDYREMSGRGIVEAMITVDSPLVRGVSMMLNNPAFMGMSGRKGQEMKRVRINGEYGLLKWNPARKQGDLSVILGNGRLMLQLKGQNLEGQKVLREMMKTWDYDAAKKTPVYSTR